MAVIARHCADNFRHTDVIFRLLFHLWFGIVSVAWNFSVLNYIQVQQFLTLHTHVYKTLHISFPLLNLIGLFVSAALGADDVFVAVDKWKSARLEFPEDSLENIAKIALPDAASAMLLTTSTTAVAFFATCICPVPPIFTFALFCGLLIIFNYILNCLFLFPALCLYDRWLENGSKNCLISFSHRQEKLSKQDSPLQENQNDFDESLLEETLTHRILAKLYMFIHSYRVIILILSVISTAVSAYFASTVSF